MIPIRIGMINSQPTAMPCAADKRCEKPGYPVNATRIICQEMNLNCTFHWYKSDEGYGDFYENGTGYGLLGAIQRGEFDMALPLLTPSATRIRGAEFSKAYFYDDIVLVTRSPFVTTQDALNVTLIYSFQWPIWICFVACLLLTTLFLTIVFKRVYSNHETQLTEPSPLVSIIDTLWAILVTEFRDAWEDLGPVRFVIITWAFSNLVLTESYKGILFSQKVTTDSQVPFKDVETFVQCMERDQCKIVRHTKSISYMDHFIYAETDTGERIRSVLNRNPIMDVNQSIMLKTIANETNVYLVWFRTKFGIFHVTESNHECKYYIVDTDYQEPGTFPLRKGSGFMEKLDDLADRFREQSLGPLLKSRYLKESSPECIGGNAKSWLDEGAGLYAERTTFYFYVIGVGVSIFGFLIELWYSRVKMGGVHNEQTEGIELGASSSNAGVL